MTGSTGLKGENNRLVILVFTVQDRDFPARDDHLITKIDPLYLYVNRLNSQISKSHVIVDL